MKKLLGIILGLAVIGLAVLAAFILVPPRHTPPSEVLAADWQPAPGQGKAVFDAGDCVACHTADGGAELAGGRPIESPMGTIYSTNITPDKETGIGNYSLDQFRAALIDGVSADGHYLYPAMPYENYRMMTEGDIRAVYSYIMSEVPAVRSNPPQTRLSFPFNLRFGIRAWNWVALRHDPGFTPGNALAAQDRGQYLVEAPGHCASCHSPRTLVMSQDGIRASQPSFLTGGTVGDWVAPPLRGADSAPQRWTVAEMASYLATGRNTHAIANGEMKLVVEHSLQHLADSDVLAIAAFLKGIDGAPVEMPAGFAPPGPTTREPLPADAAGEATAAMLTAAQPDMPLGPRLYLDNCAACHFVTGKGAPEIFPELQGNALVTAANPGPLLSVILNGTDSPGSEKRPSHLVMQGYAERLSDDEVAELASFVRQAWGNDAPAVTPAAVADERAPNATP